MTDQTIDKQTVDQLFWDTRVDASDVGVTVKEGRVTLKGVVPSYFARNAATDDAYLVEGVAFVDNKLTVKYPSVSSDQKIKEGVNSNLMWDYAIDNLKITAAVKDGIVTLTGSVDSYWKKLMAEGDAYDVKGVSDVVNELAIVLTGSWEDVKIAGDIEKALERNFFVSVKDVIVKVTHGKVNLSGEVPTWLARHSAYDCALYTAGVTHVQDDLTVSW